MNKVELTGRLTRDPDIRYSDRGDNQLCIAKFTLAVDRRFSKDEDDSADFISCVCFGKSAETIERLVQKGTKLGVVGRIQTGSYENQDGQRVYTTEVVVDEWEFEESKASKERTGNAPNGSNKGGNDSEGTNPYREGSEAVNEGFLNIPEGVDDDSLPFN